MALANITSPPLISSDNISSEYIDKYDFQEFSLLKYDLDNNFEKSYNILKRYYTDDEKHIITILENTDAITFDDVLENTDLVINRRNPPDVAAGRPDDDNVRRNMTELQKDVLKSIKKSNYSAIAQKKHEREKRQILALYQKVEQSKSKNELKKEMEKQKSGYLVIGLKILGIYGLPVAAVVGFSAFLTGFVITNPVWWHTYLILLSKNKIYFYTFLDFMSNFGLFDANEKLNLRKLYDKMINELKEKEKKEKKEEKEEKEVSKMVETIIKTIFLPLSKEDITTQKTTPPPPPPMPPLDESLKDTETVKFYNYMYTCITRKHFFNAKPDETITNKWLYYLSYIQAKTPSILMYLRVGMPVIGYIQTTQEIIRNYQNINNLIFLQKLIQPAFKTHDFMYYTNFVGESAVNSYYRNSSPEAFINQKTYDFIEYLNNVGKFFSKEEKDINIGKMFFGIGSVTDVNSDRFFIGQLSTISNMVVNMTINDFFANIEKQMQKKKIKPPQETDKSVILSIEQEMVRRAEYKKKGLTNEEIAELINPTPKKPSEYKSSIGRFMHIFYAQFKDFSDDPMKYITSLGAVITLYNGLLFTIFPAILANSSILIQKAILSGSLHFNLWKLFELEWTGLQTNVMDIIIGLIKTFFGSDELIKLKLEQFKSECAQALLEDLELLFSKLQNIYFNSRVGISINKYMSTITDNILFRCFKMSCKVIYKFNVFPTTRIMLQKAIPLNYDKDIVEFLQDRDKLTRFAAFLNHKSNNITQNFKNLNFIGVFTELLQFTDSHKVIFENLLPYLDTNNYYRTRDASFDNLSGNLLKIVKSEKSLSGVKSETTSDYIILDKEFEKLEEDIKKEDKLINFKLINTTKLVDLLKNEAKQKMVSIFSNDNSKSNIYEIFYSYYCSEFVKEKYKETVEKWETDHETWEKESEAYNKALQAHSEWKKEDDELAKTQNSDKIKEHKDKEPNIANIKKPIDPPGPKIDVTIDSNEFKRYLLKIYRDINIALIIDSENLQYPEKLQKYNEDKKKWEQWVKSHKEWKSKNDTTPVENYNQPQQPEFTTVEPKKPFDKEPIEPTKPKEEPSKIVNKLKMQYGIMHGVLKIFDEKSSSIFKTVKYTPELGFMSKSDKTMLQDVFLSDTKDFDAKFRENIETISEQELYDRNAKIDLIIENDTAFLYGNNLGFTFHSLPLLDFTDIKKTMNILFTEEEKKEPIDILSKLEDKLSKDDSDSFYLKKDLYNLNKKFNKEFSKLYNRITGVSSFFKNVFNGRNNLDIKYFGFVNEPYLQKVNEFISDNMNDTNIIEYIKELEKRRKEKYYQPNKMFIVYKQNELPMEKIIEITGYKIKCEIGGPPKYFKDEISAKLAGGTFGLLNGTCKNLSNTDNVSDNIEMLYYPDSIIKIYNYLLNFQFREKYKERNVHIDEHGQQEFTDKLRAETDKEYEDAQNDFLKRLEPVKKHFKELNDNVLDLFDKSLLEQLVDNNIFVLYLKYLKSSKINHSSGEFNNFVDTLLANREDKKSFELQFDKDNVLSKFKDSVIRGIVSDLLDVYFKKISESKLYRENLTKYRTDLEKKLTKINIMPLEEGERYKDSERSNQSPDYVDLLDKYIDDLQRQSKMLTEFYTLNKHIYSRINMNIQGKQSHELRDTLLTYLTGKPFDTFRYTHVLDYNNELDDICAVGNLFGRKYDTPERKDKIKGKIEELIYDNDIFLKDNLTNKPVPSTTLTYDSINIQNVSGLIKKMEENEFKNIADKKYAELKTLSEKLNKQREEMRELGITIDDDNKKITIDCEDLIKNDDGYFDNLKKMRQLQYEIALLIKKNHTITSLYSKINSEFDKYEEDIQKMVESYVKSLKTLEKKYIIDKPTVQAVPVQPQQQPQQPQQQPQQQQQQPQQQQQQQGQQQQQQPQQQQQQSQQQQQGQQQHQQIQQQQHQQIQQITEESISQQQMEEMEQDLGVEAAEEEELKQELGFDFTFGGPDDFFSNMINMLSNLASTNMNNNETEVSLNDNPNPDEIDEDPIKNTFEICKELTKKWYMEKNTLKRNPNNTDVDLNVCQQCKTQNLIFKFLKYMNNLLSRISSGGGAVEAGGFIEAGYRFIINGNPVKAISSILSTCGPRIIMYYYIHGLTNKGHDETVSDAILKIIWMYSMNLQDKTNDNIFKKLDEGSKALCGVFINTNMDSEINKQYNRLLEKLREYGEDPNLTINNIEKTNINGFIDLGKSLDDMSFSEIDYKNFAGVITELTSLINKENIEFLENINTNNCDILKQRPNLTLFDVLFLEIKYSSTKKYLSNYLNCLFFGTASPDTSDYLTFISSSIRPEVINVITDVVMLVLKNKSAKEATLSNLFGTKSDISKGGKNINVGREYISKKFEELEEKSKKDGTLDDIEFKKNLSKELSNIFNFIPILYNNVMDGIFNTKIPDKSVKYNTDTKPDYYENFEKCTKPCPIEKVIKFINESNLSYADTPGERLFDISTDTNVQDINLYIGKIESIIKNNDTLLYDSIELTETQKNEYLGYLKDMLNYLKYILENKNKGTNYLKQQNDVVNPIMKWQLLNPKNREKEQIVINPCLKNDTYSDKYIAIFYTGKDSNGKDIEIPTCIEYESDEIKEEEEKFKKLEKSFDTEFGLFLKNKNTTTSYQKFIGFIEIFRKDIAPILGKNGITNKYYEFLSKYNLNEIITGTLCKLNESFHYECDLSSEKIPETKEKIKEMLTYLKYHVLDELEKLKNKNYFEDNKELKTFIDDSCELLQPIEKNIMQIITESVSIINKNTDNPKINKNTQIFNFILSKMNDDHIEDDKIILYVINLLQSKLTDETTMLKNLTELYINYIKAKNSKSTIKLDDYSSLKTQITKIDGKITPEILEKLFKRIGLIITKPLLYKQSRYLSQKLKMKFNGKEKEVSNIYDILEDKEIQDYKELFKDYDSDYVSGYYLDNYNGFYLDTSSNKIQLLPNMIVNMTPMITNFSEKTDIQGLGYKISDKFDTLKKGNVNLPPIISEYKFYNYSLMEDKEKLEDYMNKLKEEIEKNREDYKKTTIFDKLSLSLFRNPQALVWGLVHLGSLTAEGLNLSRNYEKMMIKYKNIMTDLLVYNNYQFKAYEPNKDSKKGIIGVTKQDIALYKSTYNKFDTTEFLDSIETAIKKNPEFYQGKGWEYAEFNYFNNLKLEGDLKIKNDEGEFSLENIDKIPENLRYIIPLSTFYNYINNRIIQQNHDIDGKDDKFSIEYMFELAEK